MVAELIFRQNILNFDSGIDPTILTSSPVTTFQFFRLLFLNDSHTSPLQVSYPTDINEYTFVFTLGASKDIINTKPDDMSKKLNIADYQHDSCWSHLTPA